MAAALNLQFPLCRQGQDTDPIFVQCRLRGLSKDGRIDVFRDGIIPVERQQFGQHSAGKNAALGLSAHPGDRPAA